ncbi:MAG: hypothetical protein M5R36_07885 [Deltaproteobacteria bacterium]|nr:hypothetical protein [Deltaproteobacteria bacterium]
MKAAQVISIAVVILFIGAAVSVASFTSKAVTPTEKSVDGALPEKPRVAEDFLEITIPNWPDPSVAAVPFPNTSYFYAFDRVFLFGYIDNTDFTLYNSTGTPIHTGSLDDGDHIAYDVPTGIYRLDSSDLIAVLVGTADDDIVGYFALNQNSLATGTKFYSYQFRGGAFENLDRQIVFAYKDLTIVQIYNMNNGALLDSAIINAGKHFELTRASARTSI